MDFKVEAKVELESLTAPETERERGRGEAGTAHQRGGQERSTWSPEDRRRRGLDR
jgi:hypothetical protein